MEDRVELSDAEHAKVKAYADAHGLTVEQAATKLASKGLEARMRNRTRHSPASNIRSFRKK